jgi:hypothetical protein
MYTECLKRTHRVNIFLFDNVVLVIPVTSGSMQGGRGSVTIRRVLDPLDSERGRAERGSESPKAPGVGRAVEDDEPRETG